MAQFIITNATTGRNVTINVTCDNADNVTCVGTLTGTGRYNNTLNAVLTCNDSYVFNGDVSFSYVGSDTGYTVTDNATVDSESKTASINIDENIDGGETLYVSCEIIEGGGVVTQVTNNITGTTAELKTDGTLTVTAERYYNLYDVEIIVTDSDGTKTTLNPVGVVSAHVGKVTTQIDRTNAATVEINGVTAQYAIIEIGGNNVTPNVETNNGEIYPVRNTPVTLTLTANENTEMKSALLQWYTYDGNFRTQAVEFNKHSATVTFTPVELTDIDTYEPNITFHANAEPVTVVGENYGGINVYLTTLDEIEQFAKKRFFKSTGDDGTSYTYIDLGQYVNRIKRIHATGIDVNSTDVIKCGNYNTGVNTHTPKQDVLTLDFGTLTVPTYNKTSLDYKAEIQCYLPFGDVVNIPVDYVGREINLTYKINVITGGGVALFTCGGIQFLTVDVTPSSDVFYRCYGDEGRTIGGEQWNTDTLKGLQPYVIVKYYGDEQVRFTGSTAKFDELKNYNYVTAVDVMLPLTNNMMSAEHDEIINLLTQGVFMK